MFLNSINSIPEDLIAEIIRILKTLLELFGNQMDVGLKNQIISLLDRLQFYDTPGSFKETTNLIMKLKREKEEFDDKLKGLREQIIQLQNENEHFKKENEKLHSKLSFYENKENLSVFVQTEITEMHLIEVSMILK